MNENKEDNKLPAHFTLKLGVELNQIFLLRLRTSVVCLKLFNIFLGDLFTQTPQESVNARKQENQLSKVVFVTFLYIALKKSLKLSTTSPERS